MAAEFVTVQEAAAELGVSDSAVRQAILDGRLLCTVQYGRKTINRTDLEAYRARTQPDGLKPKGRPRKRTSHGNG